MPTPPASELVTLYHQRWEIETAYLELKSTILGGRVLRARTPAGIDQEIYALLVTYQLLRIAMADATGTRPGTDPDRASFTIALNTARDQVIQAAGVIADTVIDLVGTIGRPVLANLLPDRRLRVSPRVVKRAISKYNARGPTIDRTSYKATISIDILDRTSPLTPSPDPNYPALALGGLDRGGSRRFPLGELRIAAVGQVGSAGQLRGDGTVHLHVGVVGARQLDVQIIQAQSGQLQVAGARALRLERGGGAGELQVGGARHGGVSLIHAQVGGEAAAARDLQPQARALHLAGHVDAGQATHDDLLQAAQGHIGPKGGPVPNVGVGLQLEAERPVINADVEQVGQGVVVGHCHRFGLAEGDPDDECGADVQPGHSGCVEVLGGGLA